MSYTELSILLAVALLISFLLSGFEAGLLTLNSARLRRLAKDGNPGAIKLESLLGNRQSLLISILLLTATFNLLAFALITQLTVEWIGNPGYLLAFLVSLPVYMLGVELVPKHLFRRFPIRAMSTFYPVLSLIRHTLAPVISSLQSMIESLCSGGKSEDADPAHRNHSELYALTKIFEREGTLDPNETALIQSVLKFNKVKVREVMLPLNKTTAIAPDMNAATILALAERKNIDQFPILSSNGDLTGIVNIRELLKQSTPTGTARTYRRSLVRAAPDDSAISVIKRLRHLGHELAGVYTEQGRPVGVVSLEDMIQRMVKK